MKTNKSIQSGDFWSTKSQHEIPGMLVFVQYQKDALFGYPMFCESLQATGKCFLLEGHPDFDQLLDERWVNFGNCVRIDSDYLYRKLGHSQYALDCLHDFKNGQSIPLENGIPMLEGIGDPREDFHKEMIRTLEELAGESLVALTINVLRKTISWPPNAPMREYQANEVLSSFARSHSITAAFSSPSPSSFLRESHNDYCCIRNSVSDHREFAHIPPQIYSDHNGDNSLREDFILQLHNKEIRLRILSHGEIVFFVFQGEEIKEVEISLDGTEEWKKVPEIGIGSGTFVTPPSKYVSGKAQFIFKDGDIETIDMTFES